MDIMEKFIPVSFPEALGGVLALIAILSGVLSLISGLRAHTLRLLAIFVVTALALFSNNVTTYFIAIFVIATAVTELDFLQNLAAIVRGNKEYFDFKKESLSKERKLDLLAAEAARAAVVAESSFKSSPKDNGSEPNNEEKVVAGNQADEQAAMFEPEEVSPPKETPVEEVSAPSITKPDGDLEKAAKSEVGIPTKTSYRNFFPRSAPGKLSDDVRRIYELESRAFDSLELLYEKAIERGVRLRRGAFAVELDGLLTKFDGEKDLIFEVKYLRSPENFIAWIKLVGIKLQGLAKRYKEVTGENAMVHFVLILEAGVKLTARQRVALDSLEVRDVTIFNVDFLERTPL
ncbi:hypothetical protein M5G22_00490 [Pseudomonas sp. TNT2022 ID233]|uniref:hypothetical protein n=1 Tax=Pseudomonas aphyarum TaxID=2942629 RepID=UPI002362A412|nr:hypothetical protein [Pseudomonas aphyarum]MDD1136019.1 hypothetical protein [Pseudomonas aphyarum]